MNFINVLFNIRNIFFLCLFLVLTGKAIPQAVINTDCEPFINDLPLPNYISDHNISDALLDHFGTLYLSSRNKIGIFNGNKWKFVSTNGTSSLEKDSDGSIYFLDKTGPGIIYVDSSLQYQIKYLSQIYPSAKMKPGIFEKILSLHNNLYLVSKDSLLKFDQGRLIYKMTIQQNARIQKTENTIILKGKTYYHSLNNDEIKAMGIEGNSGFIFSEYNGHLVYYNESDRSVYTIDSLSRIKLFHLDFTGEVKYFTVLNTDQFLFQSIENEINITDTTGKRIVKINSLIASENPYSKLLFSSSLGKIFLINHKRVNIIDYPTVKYKILLSNLPGNIRDMVWLKEKLYILTDKGLYAGGNESLKFSHQTGNTMLPGDDFFLIAQDNQLIVFNNGKPEPILKTQIKAYSWDRENKNLLTKSDSGWIFYSDFSFSGFKNKHSISIEKEVDHVYLDSTKIYFVSSKYFHIKELSNGSALKIDLPDNLNVSDIKAFFKLDSKVNLLAGETVFTYENKTLTINKELTSFFQDNANIWFSLSNQYLARVSEINPEESGLEIYNAQKKHISYLRLPDEFQSGRFKVQLLNDSEISLFNDKFAYLYSLIPEQSPEFPITITGIQAGESRLLSDINYELSKSHLRNILNSIPYSNNDIRIEISSNDFVSGIDKHQYKLSGKASEWSEWQLGSVVNIENLKDGDYHLEIRLKNAEGRISKPSSIKFTILTPFYRSWYARFLYIFLAIIIFFLAYKTYIFNKHKLNESSEQSKSPVIYNKADFPEEPKKYEFITSISDEENHRKSKWDKYEMATVLFSDIQGFTKIAEQTNPEILIDELDRFFFHFDSVVEKYNIEKIKTIGDAYMAAGGIPKKNSSNPIEVVLAALEIQQYMKELKNSRTEIWDLRIGIHSGPVIAGIVGQKKRSYDIWGDTVNTASRMESSGEPGKVNISGVTYQLIKDYFLCDYRGRIPVKYKGNIDMYFVRGLRPELSVNLAGIPNRKFFLNIQLLRLHDLEDHVFSKLDEELPKNLYFHNSEYARHIYSHSALLAKAENLDIEETLLIRTSAILMFLGYTVKNFGVEKISSQIALEILGEFGYSEKQTSQISNLILATKLPAEPQNLLEKVILDTRLEYLGRADYIKLYKLQFLEYNQFNKPIETREWKSRQIEFLNKHEFFTPGGRRLREISAQEQIRRIEEDIW